MAALFSDWAPLSDPSKGVQQVQAWRPLLESQAARDSIFQVALDPLVLRQVPDPVYLAFHHSSMTISDSLHDSVLQCHWAIERSFHRNGLNH